MVGVLIVSHGDLGQELMSATEMIAGTQEAIKPLSIDPSKDVATLRESISSAIKEVDFGDGVLILTDMFGGTPSNMSLPFLEEGRVEVLTGVNLPMMIAIANYRKDKSLEELAVFIKSYGRKNISLATEILKRRVKKQS